MSKNKVMITGGAGFIGSKLVEKLLKDDYEVFVYDVIPLNKANRLKDIKINPNFHYQEGDLRDKTKIQKWYKKDATHLFHLASVVGVNLYIEDPLALIDIVVGGTRTLLELASIHNTRVLFTSTSEVYGKNPNIPWNESDNRVLGTTSVDRWSYSSSKAVCEHMLFALHRSKNLPFTIVRFFNVYGPGQAPIFVISKSVHQVLNNHSPFLYDSGKQTRCFTYVDDAIEGVIKASRSPKANGEIFNIGSNIETTMEKAIKLIIKHSKKNLQIKEFITDNEYGERYEDIPRRIPDVTKAKEILDWEVKTSLEKGIEKIFEWSTKNDWWVN